MPRQRPEAGQAPVRRNERGSSSHRPARSRPLGRVRPRIVVSRAPPGARGAGLVRPRTRLEGDFGLVLSSPSPTGGQSLVGHRAEIAQLVEHATENRGVASSNLALGTTVWWSRHSSGSGSVGRASPCQGEGRGFESRLPLHLFARDAPGASPGRPPAAPSSSGRTADFGSVNRGSNPRGAAILATW